MKKISLNCKDNYRIIAISDVHGHVDHLKGLLNKLKLNQEDILIIVGDFINRGINSLVTLEYIKKLSNRDNTYILKGNHEYFIHSLIENPERIGDLHDFLKEDYYETLVHSVLIESDLTVHDLSSTELLDHFKDQSSITYLKELPIMLMADGHIFVHGGYNKTFTSEGQFLKYDNYDELSGINEDKIIVGHWPACNLRYHDINNRPYFNEEKNIIFIDGGLGVKTTGELNALIIDKKDGLIDYDFIQYNDFKPATVIKSHTFNEEALIYVNYPHYQFKLLSQGDRMSICEHEHTGMKFTVFNSLLIEDNAEYNLKTNFINRFFNLSVGTEVLIVEEHEDCVLVKHNNLFGWLLREQIYD